MVFAWPFYICVTCGLVASHHNRLLNINWVEDVLESTYTRLYSNLTILLLGFFSWAYPFGRYNIEINKPGKYPGIFSWFNVLWQRTVLTVKTFTNRVQGDSNRWRKDTFRARVSVSLKLGFDYSRELRDKSLSWEIAGKSLLIHWRITFPLKRVQ
jgi:hypothetical protein